MEKQGEEFSKSTNALVLAVRVDARIGRYNISKLFPFSTSIIFFFVFVGFSLLDFGLLSFSYLGRGQFHSFFV